MSAAQLWQLLLGVLLGSITTGFVNALTLGQRITRLETLVRVVANKLDIAT